MAWSDEQRTGKRVPAALRDATLTRDGHRCTALLSDGSRCRATTRLEADHIVPSHLGGPTVLSNMTTLCHWHHNRKTQREAAAVRRATTRPGQRHPREKHPGLT